MPYEPPPELAELTLAQIAELVEARRLPDIRGWAPQQEGDSRMRIAADGTWFHDGSPITRPGMVRAFSSLLMRDEAGEHRLMTPFEKLSILVEDAPFVAVDAARKNGDLAFRLNTDELIVAGPDNALVAMGDPDRPALYLHVRRGCMARLNRSTYEQIAQIALDSGDDWWVESGGERFALRPE